MSKLGVPKVPCILIWTKKVWTNTLLSTLPTSPKSLDILEIKFALEFLIFTGILLQILFEVPSLMHEEKPQSDRDILTLTDTE